MLPCAQPEDPLDPPKDDPLPSIEIHFCVSLQNPHPVVFVQTAQSVMAEHTGGGQLPEAITKLVGEDPHRGSALDPDPDPEPAALCSIDLARASFDKH